jgi:hypothetical protein
MENQPIVYEYSKYVCLSENIRDTLNKYGIAIIPNVLNDVECDEMKNGMWNYLEHITSQMDTPIKRNIPNSWKTFKQLYPKHSMLLQLWAVGHAQFIWDLRTNPKIIEPFEKIWKTNAEDLLVSFDGASFHFPPETTNFGWANHDKSWIHCDQSFLRNGPECVQSWINAYDTNEGDATITILEGSNKYHKQFAEHFKSTNPDDWYVLNQTELDWYIKTKGCQKVNIKCPAGSMVLWDSRTIHCGTEPEKTRPKPNFRCVVYLCYTPRIKANEKIIEKRIEAWKNLRMTTHCPHISKLFPITPRTFGKQMPIINPITHPLINDLGYKLIGYDSKP